MLLHESDASRARANNDSREALKLLKQRRLCQRGEACIGRTAMPDFALGMFHGEKRFAKMAQHFEMAQQKCVQRFAVFARSAVGPLSPERNPRISLRSIRGSAIQPCRPSSCPRIAVRKNGVASLAYVAGIHVFTACVRTARHLATGLAQFVQIYLADEVRELRLLRLLCISKFWNFVLCLLYDRHRRGLGRNLFRRAIRP